MFHKLKKIFSSIKIVVIILIVLLIIEFALVVYLAVKAGNLKQEFAQIGPQEKLETLHNYALVLEKLEQFRRKNGQNDTTAKLEKAVLDTDSGVLKSLFDEIVLGDNLEKDMDYFMDAVIDSLKFFSQPEKNY